MNQGNDSTTGNDKNLINESGQEDSQTQNWPNTWLEKLGTMIPEDWRKRINRWLAFLTLGLSLVGLLTLPGGLDFPLRSDTPWIGDWSSVVDNVGRMGARADDHGLGGGGRPTEHGLGGGGRPTEFNFVSYQFIGVLLIVGSLLLLWALGFMILAEAAAENSFFRWALNPARFGWLFFLVLGATIAVFHSDVIIYAPLTIDWWVVGIVLIGLAVLTWLLLRIFGNPSWYIHAFVILLILGGLALMFLLETPQAVFPFTTLYSFAFGIVLAILAWLVLVIFGPPNWQLHALIVFFTLIGLALMFYMLEAPELAFWASIILILWLILLSGWGLMPYIGSLVLFVGGLALLNLEWRWIGLVTAIGGFVWFLVAAQHAQANFRPFLRAGALLIVASIFMDRGIRLLANQHLMYWDAYYKVCDEDCVMHGSIFGDRYDEPCGDNIAFMVNYVATDQPIDTFMQEYMEQNENPTVMPSVPELPLGLAYHGPIFPDKQDTASYFLTGVNRPIREAELYIQELKIPNEALEAGQVTPAGIVSFKDEHLKARWTRLPLWNEYGMEINGEDSVVETIEYKLSPENAEDAVVSDSIRLGLEEMDTLYLRAYKFRFRLDAPPETLRWDSATVVHALRPYSLHHPAPVYARSDPEFGYDVVLIPATDAWNTSVDAEHFNESCGILIRQVLRNEPNIRYWNKNFNFYINPIQGYAAESCPTCCHVPPANIDNLSFAEAKALLHESEFQDFAHCGVDVGCGNSDCSLFSAELPSIYHDDSYTIRTSNDTLDLNISSARERYEHEYQSLVGNAFLHELGHTLFYLKDEYQGGWNGEDTEQFPNNWSRLYRARAHSLFRHKEPANVNSVH